MSQDINESDWKRLRDLSRVALDRFCERTLRELVHIATDPDKGAHARYGEVYRKIHEEDEKIAKAFNGLSRSNALLQMALMRRYGLITDDEMSQFSQETQDWIGRIVQL